MSEISKEIDPKTHVWELVKKISYDKRVDRMDLPEVGALETALAQEKTWVISQTKEKLLSHIEQSLIDGFTVETQDDYEVLKKLLSLLWKKQVLPEYKMAHHLADRTGKSAFSVSFDKKDNTLKLYSNLPQDIQKNRHVESFSFMGQISLDDGSFTPKNVITQYQSDYLRNNNMFDMNQK